MLGRETQVMLANKGNCSSYCPNNGFLRIFTAWNLQVVFTYICSVVVLVLHVRTYVVPTMCDATSSKRMGLAYSFNRRRQRTNVSCLFSNSVCPSVCLSWLSFSVRLLAFPHEEHPDETKHAKQCIFVSTSSSQDAHTHMRVRQLCSYYYFLYLGNTKHHGMNKNRKWRER